MKSFTGILIAFALFLGYNAIYVLDEGEQAIVTMFGKPVGEAASEAGLYFKLPMLQKVHYFEKRILKWDGDPNEIPTKDKKYIWVDTTARWKISDPLLFMQRVKDINRATYVLNDLVNGKVRDFVTKNDLVEIIRSSDWQESYTLTTETTGRKKAEVNVGRDQFSRMVLSEVSEVTRSFGIELLDVLVKRINYTTQVRDTVYARMISERKRIAAQIRSEGQANRANILGDMDKQLKQIESNAYKKSEEIRGNADGMATKIYGNAYNRDPKFYQFLTTLDSYKTVLGKNTKLVIDADSPLYKYFKGINKGM